MLKKYIQERDAHKAQIERQAAKQEHRTSARPRHQRNELSKDTAKPTAYRHVSNHTASNSESHTDVRKPQFSYLDLPVFEPLEPTHTKASGKRPEKRRDSNDPLEQIRATLDSRPKTSAAACIDYAGPSAQSSNSTSRSNTTYDEFGRPSTGRTSVAMTPGDDKRASFNPGRLSQQTLPEDESSSIADATARAWMAQELARRRAEYKRTGQAARPGSRASAHPNRPVSRAGSIAESVFEGVMDYIKPKASMDSLRSDYALSRSQSRSSSIKSSRSNRWSRVKGIRRKNSWSSFRSAKPEPEPPTSVAPDGGVNLNRALPALPGLDQYKEKKAKPAHIAQLMYGGRAKSVPNTRQRPVMAGPDSKANRFSTPEDHKRQADLRKAVEEKMRVGSISRGEQLPIHPLVQGNSFYTKGNNAAPASDLSITALESSTAPLAKKPGLRKKLSRFLGFQGSKDKKQSSKLVASK